MVEEADRKFLRIVKYMDSKKHLMGMWFGVVMCHLLACSSKWSLVDSYTYRLYFATTAPIRTGPETASPSSGRREPWTEGQWGWSLGRPPGSRSKDRSWRGQGHTYCWGELLLLISWRMVPPTRSSAWNLIGIINPEGEEVAYWAGWVWPMIPLWRVTLVR